MTRRLAVLVAVGLMAAACSGDAEESTGDEPPTSSTAAAPTTTVTPSSTTTSPSTETTAAAPTPGLMAGPGQRSSWRGTIDDRIRFTMWVAQSGTHLFGELAYDTVGEPIILVGRSNPETGLVVLREFAADGRVTGTLSLDVTGDVRTIEGLWDEFDLLITSHAGTDEPFVFDPVFREGEYRYRFPPFDEGSGALCCGAAGFLQLSFVDADSLVVEFENVRGAPSFNLATIAPTEIPIVGSRAVYDSRDIEPDGPLDCAFTIAVYDGFAAVDHIDDRWDCGFGMGAGVEGVYLLTDPERWG